MTAVKWQLKYFGSASDTTSVIDSTNLTVLFDKDGTVSGSSGCNTYFSDYTSDADGNLAFSAIAVTKMYCMSPDGVMEQETKYLNALQDVKRFEIQTNILKLFHGDTDEFLYFTPAGCVTNDDCSAGSYCVKEIGDCEGLGTCTIIPKVCITLYLPVCGCDGNTYSNSCVAASYSVNVSSEENCDS